ncbi:MAG: hypothetical protein ACJARN_002034 [Arenicella sp.]|jgi:hypothetical protein
MSRRVFDCDVWLGKGSCLKRLWSYIWVGSFIVVILRHQLEYIMIHIRVSVYIQLIKS